MGLVTIIFVSIVGLGVAHWLVPTWIARRLRSVRVLQAPRYLLALVACELLRTVFLVATLSASVVAVAIFFAGLSGSTTEQIGAAVGRVQRLRDLLGVVGPAWTGVLVAVLVVAHILLHRTYAKRTTSRAITAAVERERRRMEQAIAAGEFVPVADSEDSQELGGMLASGLSQLKTIEQAVTASGGDPEAHSEYRRCKSAVLMILQAREQLEIAQRLEQQSLVPDDFALPPPGNWLERVKTFFVSRGLFETLGRGRRGLYLFATFLVVPSLVGMQIGTGAVAARSARLEQLLVEASASEASRDWREAKQQLPTAGDEPWSPADESALTTASRVFEESLAAVPTQPATAQLRDVWAVLFTERASPHGKSPAKPAAMSSPEATELEAQVRRLHVRQRVLQELSAQEENAPRLDGVLSETKGLSAIQKDTLAAYDAANQVTAPTSGLGQRFQIELRAETERSPGLRARLRDALARSAGSFMEPTTVRSLRSSLVTTTLSALVDGTLDTGGAMVDLARAAAGTLRPEAVSRFYGIRRDRFMRALATGSSLTEAGAQAAWEEARRPEWTSAEGEGLRVVLGGVSEVETLGAPLAGHPPALSGVDLGGSQDWDPVVKGLKAHNQARMAAGGKEVETWADPMTTFEDLFPGQVGSNEETAHGKTIKRNGSAPEPPPVSPNLEPEPPGPRPRSPKGGAMAAQGFHDVTVAKDFNRAHSFDELDTYHRIGGVLIGQTPGAASAPLDFRDLRWTILDGRVSLVLSRADGKEIAIGPYSAAVVRRALAYAADGRPTAVTIMPATPLEDRRIYVHPALVDSALGCHAIEIDHFVFRYHKDPEAQRTRKIADAHLKLLRLAFSTRRSLYDEYHETARKGQLRPASEVPAQLINSLGRFMLSQLDASEQHLAAEGLRSASAMDDRTRSPLPKLAQLYDGRLVGEVRGCALGSGTPQTLVAFSSCIVGKVIDDLGGRFLSEEQAHTAPPEPVHVSGVREEPYELDPDMNFLRADSPLWPLRFKEQLVFAIGSKDSGMTDHAWELESLADGIRATVLRTIRGNESARRTFETIRELTVTQRLFRTAFGGGLGPHFPLERLVALAADTRPKLGTSSPTPRWQPEPGAKEIEFLTLLFPAQFAARNLPNRIATLEEQSRAFLREADRKVTACMNLLSSHGTAADWDRISVASWNAACDLGGLGGDIPPDVERTVGGSFIKDAALKSQLMMNVRQVRNALGLDRLPKLDQLECPTQ